MNSTRQQKGGAVREENGAAVVSGAGVSTNAAVLEKLRVLYLEAFAHDGFAGIQVEIRILRRGQKEVILHCGKQYRFVVDCVQKTEDGRQSGMRKTAPGNDADAGAPGG
jgi:hypothetical protein